MNFLFALWIVSVVLLHVFSTSSSSAIPSGTGRVLYKRSAEGTSSSVCTNIALNVVCQQWSSSGLCSKPSVSQWCQMSCGGCQGPIHGGFSQWHSWAACSQTCAGGIQRRFRFCTNPRPANGGRNCSGLGPATETRTCNTQNCSLACTDIASINVCQQWYNNGHCSNPTVKNWCKKTCHGCQAIFGQGGYPYQSGLNTLVCANVANDTQCYKWFSSGLCLNPGVRQYCRMTCGTCQGVPVHGGYSQWNSWSPCSLSGGTQQRSRSCTSPRPANGGRDCNALGSATESRNCNNIQSCPDCGGAVSAKSGSTMNNTSIEHSLSNEQNNNNNGNNDNDVIIWSG